MFVHATRLDIGETCIARGDARQLHAHLVDAADRLARAFRLRR